MNEQEIVEQNRKSIEGKRRQEEGISKIHIRLSDIYEETVVFPGGYVI